MAESNWKTGSTDVLIQPQQGEIHPRGLLSAIGYIEQSYANERGGCLINSEFLTTPQRLEFMEVGFRSSLASGIVMALLSPLAIGVLQNYIPIFGSYDPSLYDKFCGLMLAIMFSLGYSFFLASAAVKYLGGYSRAMVFNLVGGVAIASFVKGVVVFIAFHFLYFKVLSPKNVAWALKQMYVAKLSYEDALKIFTWIMDFKKVFITSSYFVLISTCIFVLIPYAAMLWAYFRNKKLIEAGVVDVFRQDA